jgi:hypothetical protein
MSLNAIQSAIPHREQFLLVDEIVEKLSGRHNSPRLTTSCSL